MKKLLISLLFLLFIAMFSTGCQKRAVCTYPLSNEVVRFYEKDYGTANAYNNAVQFAESNGYVCEEKSVSALSK